MNETTPEMASLSRVRTAFAWMRRNGKPVTDYPRLPAMTPAEIDDAEKFAAGFYPTPHRWTLRLYELARSG